MQIKLDKADVVFSQVIRLRDKKCMRCGSAVKFNAKGMPVSHQNSHFFGRGQESTRYSLDNCDTLCYGCHVLWGSKDREDYREFKIKQLGRDKFNWLLVNSKMLKKKDRKLELIKAKELVKIYLQQKEL